MFMFHIYDLSSHASMHIVVSDFAIATIVMFLWCVLHDISTTAAAYRALTTSYTTLLSI
jgi:hypothetical protein